MFLWALNTTDYLKSWETGDKSWMFPLGRVAERVDVCVGGLKAFDLNKMEPS